MPTITDYYGISGLVPFENVGVLADNRLFLDPHAIRLSTGPLPFATDAVACADSFLNEVTKAVMSSKVNVRRRGKQLLQHFVEPWETRLGMSEAGFSGHGGADVVGSWIWDTLNDDVESLVRVGVLRQLEDLPLFVDGVDRDITSDITTRIVFGPLARFTEAMIAKFPEFTAGSHEIKKFTKQVWNPSLLEWDKEIFTLPVVEGKPLVLVPKGWARPTLLMSATRFYETSVLTYAQLAQSVRLSNGKVLKTPKDSLKTQPGLARGRKTNLRVTMTAFEDEQDLLGAFKEFVASRLAANGDDHLAA